MNKGISPGPVSGNTGTCIKEAVCIHTDKVYDSCRDKECLEDLRVYLTVSDQEIVDRAVSIKATTAELIWVSSDVEPVPFHSGYYSIDIRFFFRVTLDVCSESGRPKRVEGLAVYDKKVVLFGSEGKSKVFRSNFVSDGCDKQLAGKTNLPQAVVEAVDPITLSAKFVDRCCQRNIQDDCYDIASTPEGVCGCFENVFADPRAERRVYVTLGLFTIIKLERSVQLLIPVYDFCIPENESVSSTQGDPCDLFDKIKFPVDEFYPPQKHDFGDGTSNGCSNCC